MRILITLIILLITPSLIWRLLEKISKRKEKQQIEKQEEGRDLIGKIVRLKKYLLDKVGFNYRLYFPFLWFAIYGFVDYKNLWPDRFYFDSLSYLSFIQGSTDFILYLTLLAIASYTFETYRLRDETYRTADATITANQLSSKIKDEMVMTNILSIQPGLIVEYERDRGDWQIFIRNVGNGVALDVSIQSHNSDFDFQTSKKTILSKDKLSVDVWRLGRPINDFTVFGTTPVRIIITFNRVKPLPYPLITEVELRNPPFIQTVRQDWRIKVS